jgi:hypothetical protein
MLALYMGPEITKNCENTTFVPRVLWYESM